YAVPRRPEVQPRHPTLVKKFPMDPNRTLPFQEADCERHAVLGRNAQAQVDVVGHRMPFHQLDASLSAQVPQDRADLTPKPSVEDLAAVLRYHHNVVLAILQSHRTWDRLCHSCIGSSFLPHGAFPEVGAYGVSAGMHAGSLEALWVTRPEAVVLASNNLGACPNICSCSRMAAGFRWALAFSASAQPCARTIPLNLPRRCRSGARSSKDC